MSTVEVGEQELQERDERVEAAVRATLKRWRDEADQLERDARMLRTDARLLEASVKAEAWWNLTGILDQDTIESLCEVSPKDLLGGRDV